MFSHLLTLQTSLHSPESKSPDELNKEIKMRWMFRKDFSFMQGVIISIIGHSTRYIGHVLLL